MSSGGGKKMRGNKAGWEEAGAEFYQESYPAGSEWDQRDPAAIATLLPSKQNRFGKTKANDPSNLSPRVAFYFQDNVFLFLQGMARHARKSDGVGGGAGC